MQFHLIMQFLWPQSGYYGDRAGLATVPEGVPPVGSETLGRMVREGTVEREGREGKRGEGRQRKNWSVNLSLPCLSTGDGFISEG